MTAHELVPRTIGRVRFDGSKSLWLWGMLATGVVYGIPAATPRLVAASAALAVLTLCLGHSVGLHRGVIHRTYETNRTVRGALVYLFVLSGLGSPLAWARLHAVRDYWQNRLDCPRYFAYDHSLARDFVWNLHTTFEPADARAEATLRPDVTIDPWLRFLDRTWRLHVVLLAAVVYVASGPAGVAVCICARTAAGILGHWFVGYAVHAWGERRFHVAGARESGTNVWALGVLSFGEGFHNNHHAHPNSARMGMRRFDLDLGWAFVRAFEVLGIVRQVRAWHRHEPRARAVTARSLTSTSERGAQPDPCRSPRRRPSAPRRAVGRSRTLTRGRTERSSVPVDALGAGRGGCSRLPWRRTMKTARRTRPPTTPGEILREEYLAPLGMTQKQLADHLRCDVKVVNRIVNGRSAVTADMALRLGAAFGTTADFWLNAQTSCDLFSAAKAAGPLPRLLVPAT